MSILKETALRWDDFNYSEEAKEEIKLSLQQQLEKHQTHAFVSEYYQRCLNKFN